MKKEYVLKDFQKCSETQHMTTSMAVHNIREGPTVKTGKCDVDNRWRVFYDSWLLQKLSTYINLEVRAALKSAKYLYTYVYNTASIQLQGKGIDGL